MASTIEVSAQFGGNDAADAVLPHYRALKAAEVRCTIAGLPFRQMAFILRVDGSVNSYHLVGAGNLAFGRNYAYVSIDIGIGRDQWSGTQPGTLASVIVSSIL